MTKKASGALSRVASFGAKAAEFVGKHADTIMKVVSGVHQGIGVARDMGLLSSDSALSQADDLLGMVTGSGFSEPGEGFYCSRLIKKRF